MHKPFKHPQARGFPRENITSTKQLVLGFEGDLSARDRTMEVTIAIVIAKTLIVRLFFVLSRGVEHGFAQPSVPSTTKVRVKLNTAIG